MGRLRGRSVGDTRDVGDLDDIGRPSENGRGDGLGRLALGSGSGELVALLLLRRPFGAPRTDDEPPDDEEDGGYGNQASDNPSGDGTGVILLWRRVTRASRRWDTLGGGTRVTCRAGHGTSLAGFAFGAFWGRLFARHAASEEGAGGREANEAVEIAIEQHGERFEGIKAYQQSTRSTVSRKVESTGIKECSRLERRQVVRVKR